MPRNKGRGESAILYRPPYLIARGPKDDSPVNSRKLACLFEICLFEDWAAVNPPRFLGESGSLTETTSIALTVVLGSR